MPSNALNRKFANNKGSALFFNIYSFIPTFIPHAQPRARALEGWGSAGWATRSSARSSSSAGWWTATTSRRWPWGRGTAGGRSWSVTSLSLSRIRPCYPQLGDTIPGEDIKDIWHQKEEGDLEADRQRSRDGGHEAARIQENLVTPVQQPSDRHSSHSRNHNHAASVPYKPPPSGPSHRSMVSHVLLLYAVFFGLFQILCL